MGGNPLRIRKLRPRRLRQSPPGRVLCRPRWAIRCHIHRAGVHNAAVRILRRSRRAAAARHASLVFDLSVKMRTRTFSWAVAHGTWALNSAVECHPHTVEVVGSNPTAPTIPSKARSEEVLLPLRGIRISPGGSDAAKTAQVRILQRPPSSLPSRSGPYGNPYPGRGSSRKLETRYRASARHPSYFQQVTFRLPTCITTCRGVLQERHAINGVTFPEQKGVPRERPFFLSRNNAETPSPVPAFIGIG